MTNSESPLKPKQVKKIHTISGVNLSFTNSEERYIGRDDLILISFKNKSNFAGVFTKSTTASEAVKWCQKIIKNNDIRAIIVNAGNANVFTGELGKSAINKIISKLSSCLKIFKNQILIAQTGVIGEPLKTYKIVNAISNLTDNLNSNNWQSAAKAIMTTDTYPKYSSLFYNFEGSKIHITGIAKGSGMIAPNMGTMLAFISTDIKISRPILQKLLEEVSEETFNSISVDGDTSTSDSVILSATGMSDNKILKNKKDKHYEKFKDALLKISKDLALQIVRDGEGASKLITIRVSGTKNKFISKKVAFSIANSPLVKTAIAAEDANWGRIIMAIGKTNEIFDHKKLRIYIGKYLITYDGRRNKGYNENKLSKYMKNNEIEISVEFGSKKNEATVWTCDLTQKYIDINGKYRS
ncbi:bifunctional glutamate N-acetyltransferase/amino-acid acetyltransferase ArgJ [SAR116 cluster bacterium]|nr:bifunctional glutamate N-acetyltransferase/amino-acid acetyltransferase ArgJ [SAR116 cluster bacterium]